MAIEQTSLYEITPEKYERMSFLLKEIGLEIDKIRPDIINRLVLLDEATHVVEDEHKAMHMAKAVFNWYKENKPEKSWSEEEMREVLIGSIFSDIGKTGPRMANLEQQRMVAAIYSIDSKDWGSDEDKMSLARYMEKYFSQDFGRRIEICKSAGINVEMVMRKFWDMHANWTLEIISGDGVPPEAVAAAASHHFIQGNNPQNIIGADGRFAKYFGENLSFDRPEKLICLLDVYDAFRRRGLMTHEQAILALRKKIDSSSSFSGDKDFHELIDVIDFTNRV
jgi:hypothetical protein